MALQKLKAKAANARYVLPVVRHVLLRYFPPATAHEKLRYNCLARLDDFYIELSDWKVDSGPRAAQLGREHVLLYAELSAQAASMLDGHNALIMWRIVRFTNTISFVDHRFPLVNSKFLCCSSYKLFSVFVLSSRMYPKHHLFLHIIEDQILFCGNPRDHWCYGDESEIGIAVRIAKSLHPSFLHRAIVAKLRIQV